MNILRLEKDDFSTLDPVIQALFRRFDDLNIAHETYSHPPIFTVAEGIEARLPAHIPGQHGKSLFLTNQKGGFWLVVAREDIRVNLKPLAVALDAKRFSFANTQDMTRLLGVMPGSVTPFALVNDTERQIKVIIDQGFDLANRCVFHPLDNRYSTVIAVSDLYRFIDHLGYKLDIRPIA